MRSLPETEPEIDRFLADFESCVLPKESFTHAAHLFTGACVVHRVGETAGIDHMRQCIRRFNEAVGGENTATGGYHETVTVFWVRLLTAFRSRQAELARAEFAALAVEMFADRRGMLAEYYDFDVVASVEARRVWIAPTLKAIEPANL